MCCWSQTADPEVSLSKFRLIHPKSDFGPKLLWRNANSPDMWGLNQTFVHLLSTFNLIIRFTCLHLLDGDCGPTFKTPFKSNTKAENHNNGSSIYPQGCKRERLQVSPIRFGPRINQCVCVCVGGEARRASIIHPAGPPLNNCLSGRWDSQVITRTPLGFTAE